MKKKFFILIAIDLILTFLDGFLTYYNTPDLTYEDNPLVTVFGLGWGALFLANFITFWLLFILGYYAFVKYQTITVKVNNRKEYISQIFFNRPDKIVWCWYKMPKNWKPTIAIIGYSYTYALIVARAILVFQWLLFTFRVDFDAYERFRSFFPLGRFDIAAAMICLICLCIYWVNNEYMKSKTAVADLVE